MQNAEEQDDDEDLCGSQTVSEIIDSLLKLKIIFTKGLDCCILF